jgi:hypothetical protein
MQTVSSECLTETVPLTDPWLPRHLDGMEVSDPSVPEAGLPCHCSGLHRLRPLRK